MQMVQNQSLYQINGMNQPFRAYLRDVKHRLKTLHRGEAIKLLTTRSPDSLGKKLGAGYSLYSEKTGHGEWVTVIFGKQ